ncbi:MAG TPA: AbrB/MazE/SpoVT family DNA-binding domain-containing protein [Candidatus Nanoarchaeia archaeon]|nr:AbrB/MazE/SpoVT family DNA-binding domain-containing protein [Candidatus Nanoarchaeia archaeon]
MECITKLRKVGGSLMATIPKEIVEEENLASGMAVKIEVKKMKKSYLGMARGIGPLTKEDKKWMEGKDD